VGEERETFASLGARPFVARVELDLASAGSEVVALRHPARHPSPLSTSPTARDVAILVAKGFSNPEVA
jgi:hypothetical protein